MAVSVYFNQEVQTVDPTKTLTYTVNTSTYDYLEFSYSGLAITAGSELGCEYGASHWAEAAGFRWYVPNPLFWKRPATIPTGLTQAKTTFWMENSNMFEVYGNSWTTADDRDYINGAVAKWRILNGMNVSIYPSGHRWPDIITKQLAFFQANPTLVRNGLAGLPPNVSNQAVIFALDTLTPGSANYNKLVEICASVILHQDTQTAWTQFHRSHMDPVDGSPFASDITYPFVRAVAQKVRAGTNAIGTNPSKTGVADAMLGLYAYNEHTAPPTASYAPEVYVSVATAYNDDYDTDELIEGHGPKAAAVLMREYWDTEVWSHGMPQNSRAKSNYFDAYPDFRDAGAIGIINEWSGHYLNNLIQARYGIRLLKTGNSGYTWQDAIDEVVADIFDDDESVRSFYELIGDPEESWNFWNLRRCMELTDAMTGSWYRDYYRTLMCFCYLYMTMPNQRTLDVQNPAVYGVATGTPKFAVGVFTGRAAHDAKPTGFVYVSRNGTGSGWTIKTFTKLSGVSGDWGPATDWVIPDAADPHRVQLTRMMSGITAKRRDIIVHAYAVARQMNNSAVIQTYPDLHFGMDYVPWIHDASAFTETEFQTYKAAVVTATPHDTAFDSEDLVIVKGVTPLRTPQASGPATRFQQGHGFHSMIVFVGPGKVFRHDPSTTPWTLVSETEYGEGVHRINSYSDSIYTHAGGYVFYDLFPMGGTRPNGSGEYWLYVPQRAAGNAKFAVSIRMVIQDATTTFTMSPSTTSIAITAGQCRVNDTLTTGQTSAWNVNRYMSLRPDIVLLPREIADEDFPNRSKITLV